MAQINLPGAFSYRFAENGSLEPMEDTQYRTGWAYIGATPPSVEQFNKVFNVLDWKANYLYQQITALPAAIKGRLLNIQTFTASGTYTPTPGTVLTTIEIIGAGGSGCGAAATGSGQFFVGTGGGAGAYARCYVNPAAGAPVAITIGAGGAAVSGFASNPGGASSYGNQILCPGGLGGTGAGPAAAPFQAAGVDASALPSVTLPGATSLATRGAGAAGAFAVGGVVMGSMGAASFFGGGGVSLGGAGGQAPNYGAGGGGAVIGSSTGALPGGKGGDGVCIIYEYGAA